MAVLIIGTLVVLWLVWSVVDACCWRDVRRESPCAAYQQHALTGRRRYHAPPNARSPEDRWLLGGAFYTPAEQRRMLEIWADLTLFTQRLSDEQAERIAQELVRIQTPVLSG